MKDKRPRMHENEEGREAPEPAVEADEQHAQILMPEPPDAEQTPLSEVPAPAEEPDESGFTLADLQTMKADLDNARKRFLRESTRMTAYATKDLMRRLLPVLDHFHLALEHGEGGGGVQLAIKELMDVLASEGLEEIQVEDGDRFDPNVHHALASHVDDAVDVETVTGVHRRGYRFKEHVLRAPEVLVAQPPDRSRQE